MRRLKKTRFIVGRCVAQIVQTLETETNCFCLFLLVGGIFIKNSKGNKPLKIYKIDKNYIKFLEESDTTIFHDSGSRVYIGIILSINGLDYFAPLSSFSITSHILSFSMPSDQYAFPPNLYFLVKPNLNLMDVSSSSHI